MDAVVVITGGNGRAWRVEHRESEALSSIDGYLMTCDDEGILTIRARMSDARKHLVRERLVQQLRAEIVGRASSWIVEREDALAF